MQRTFSFDVIYASQMENLIPLQNNGGSTKLKPVFKKTERKWEYPIIMRDFNLRKVFYTLSYAFRMF